MNARIICTTLAILTAGSLSAVAQEKGKRPEGDRPQRKVPPELLEKFDKNGDGKLDEAERKEAAEARKGGMEKRHAEMIKRFDTDGDGELSESERKAAREAMEAKKKEILEKYDANGDGKLDEAERKTAIDAGEKLPPHPMKRPGGDRAGKGAPGPGGPGRGKGAPGPGGPGRGKGKTPE
jgi:Ca2+-binding EF-hand superfamily protein